jgi:hypothetical protein
MAMRSTHLGQTCPTDQTYNLKPKKRDEILATVSRYFIINVIFLVEVIQSL